MWKSYLAHIFICARINNHSRSGFGRGDCYYINEETIKSAATGQKDFADDLWEFEEHLLAGLWFNKSRKPPRGAKVVIASQEVFCVIHVPG
jgi:hypothetical protein